MKNSHREYCRPHMKFSPSADFVEWRRRERLERLLLKLIGLVDPGLAGRAELVIGSAIRVAEVVGLEHFDRAVIADRWRPCDERTGLAIELGPVARRLGSTCCSMRRLISADRALNGRLGSEAGDQLRRAAEDRKRPGRRKRRLRPRPARQDVAALPFRGRGLLDAVYPVEVTVTYNGNPLTEADVYFVPDDGNQRFAAVGSTDANGTARLYTLNKYKGAKAGPHNMSVSK